MKNFIISESIKTLIDNRNERWYHKYTNDDLLVYACHERDTWQKRINSIITQSENPTVYGNLNLESERISEQDLQSLIDQFCLLSTMSKYRQIELEGLNEELSRLLHYNQFENDNLPPISVLIGFIFGLVVAILLPVFAPFGGSWGEIVVTILFPFLWSLILPAFCYIVLASFSFIFNIIVANKYIHRYNVLLTHDSVYSRLHRVDVSQRNAWRIAYNNKTKHSEEMGNLSKLEEAKNDAPQIIQKWDLLEFAKLKGKMQVGSFVNTESFEEFKCNIFTDNEGNKCYVSFGAKLGELTPAEIIQRKDHLEVIMLNTGTYILQEKKD